MSKKLPPGPLCAFALAALLASTGCSTTQPRRDPTGEVFPSIRGSALDGRSVSIPGLIPGMFAGSIDAGMRSGIPREDWGSVITIYADAGKVVRFTGNEVPLPGRIVLLDRSGRVVFFHDSGFSVKALRRLEEALKSLEGPGPQSGEAPTPSGGTRPRAAIASEVAREPAPELHKPDRESKGDQHGASRDLCLRLHIPARGFARPHRGARNRGLETVREESLCLPTRPAETRRTKRRHLRRRRE